MLFVFFAFMMQVCFCAEGTDHQVYTTPDCHAHARGCLCQGPRVIIPSSESRKDERGWTESFDISGERVTFNVRSLALVSPKIGQGCGFFSLVDEKCFCREELPLSGLLCATEFHQLRLPQSFPPGFCIVFRPVIDGCCGRYKYVFSPPTSPPTKKNKYRLCRCADAAMWPAPTPFSKEELKKYDGDYKPIPFAAKLAFHILGSVFVDYASHFIYAPLKMLGFVGTAHYNATGVSDHSELATFNPATQAGIPLFVFAGGAVCLFNVMAFYESRGFDSHKIKMSDWTETQIWLANSAYGMGLEFYKTCPVRGPGHQRPPGPGYQKYPDYVPQFLCMDPKHLVAEEEAVYVMKNGMGVVHGGSLKAPRYWVFSRKQTRSRAEVKKACCPRCHKSLCVSHPYFKERRFSIKLPVLSHKSPPNLTYKQRKIFYKRQRRKNKKLEDSQSFMRSWWNWFFPPQTIHARDIAEHAPAGSWFRKWFAVGP